MNGLHRPAWAKMALVVACFVALASALMGCGVDLSPFGNRGLIGHLTGEPSGWHAVEKIPGSDFVHCKYYAYDHEADTRGECLVW